MKKNVMRRRQRSGSAAYAPVYIFVLFAVCVIFSAAFVRHFFRKSPTHDDFIHEGTKESGNDTSLRPADTYGGVPVGTANENTPDTENTTPYESERESGPDAEAEEKDSWMLILVNKDSPLPDDFSVSLTDLPGGHRADARIADELKRMLDDMRKEGLSPVICSSYRTNDKQTQLYENKVRKYTADGMTRADAERAASMWVAPPGTSEHQTGLAFDIVDKSYQLLDEKQEETPVQRWLMKNSYKYGFILRYPNEKSSVTGINYEPWHYRYVGVTAAREIYDSGLCLEEYLKSAARSGA